MYRFILFLMVLTAAGLNAAAETVAPAPLPAFPAAWRDAIEEQIVDYYQDPDAGAGVRPIDPSRAIARWTPVARAVVGSAALEASLPLAAGRLRARMQQGLVLQMNRAVLDGRIADAQAARADLDLPRGASAVEGALLLQTLQGDQRNDAARILTREALTWQATRARQLMSEAAHAVARTDTPMPGRLQEELGEAVTLANLPAPLREAAGLPASTSPAVTLPANVQSLADASWATAGPTVAKVDDAVDASLPSLLTAEEAGRRERLLLKLCEVIPKEYGSGVREGQITVPLEYREAVSFAEQARQLTAELTPPWVSRRINRATIEKLDATLAHAGSQIDGKVDPSDLQSTLSSASSQLQSAFGVSLHRAGTTADIVDEVMVEVRSSLSASLAAAVAGHWADAERLRVEAYTTFDPELEARLVPRDPSLATDIERLLLDGIDAPGVKLLLDKHAPSDELQVAYGRVFTALNSAAVELKAGISPTAAVVGASSIVLREGLEGLLVVIAILAGLRGEENLRRRRLFWLGIAASVAVTLLTWVLSQTLIKDLRNYGEVIEAVTGLLAVVVLLLITNWLFHQVYWRQWVTTLKGQAAGENAWQLVSVGFLVGYREGFETVLFLQSLALDAGGKSVALGVLIGSVGLVAMGVAALRLGMKLPYFRILLLTAGLIGLVLVTFVGGTARAMQTIGWIPVHRLTPGSWPAWMGNWLGLHNTVESVAIQIGTIGVVLGTWRFARWQAKRKTARRRAELSCAVTTQDGLTPCGRPASAACTPDEAVQPSPALIRLTPPRVTGTSAVHDDEDLVLAQ